MDVAHGLGSRFRKLNNQPSAFARWQKYSFRKMLPPVERDELRSMPKLWEMGGVTSLTLKPGENTGSRRCCAPCRRQRRALRCKAERGVIRRCTHCPQTSCSRSVSLFRRYIYRAAQVWRHAGC